jgi:hypothetical protein
MTAGAVARTLERGVRRGSNRVYLQTNVVTVVARRCSS